ncbi:hypothetical protein RhiirA1_478199 [Rhizophagus irregularis]|uniref:Uncharacterized protein n=1 Tax=Rhizophagus irregularis TaxID=588596 RepID=A0A2N0QSE4_9GLOM|nr:hypothetical protein RhiirA1_478199 [Rhizophagus irregularis]
MKFKVPDFQHLIEIYVTEKVIADDDVDDDDDSNDYYDNYKLYKEQLIENDFSGL